MKKEYLIEFLQSAKKDLEKIPDKYHLRIGTIISVLSINPYIGKKLDGKFLGCFVVRAWPYRIIYSIHKLEIKIYIIKIGHRKDVYR